MEIRIVARHFDLTESLHRSITQKINRLLKHFSGIIDSMVILSTSRVKSEQYQVEVNLNIRGKLVCAKTCGTDMYVAIDNTVKKLDRQLVSHKNIIQNHKHEPIKHYAYNRELQMVAEAPSENESSEQFS